MRRAERWNGLLGGSFEFDQLSAEGEQWLLAHSREREMEADRLALRYLERAGYPPEAMASVIALLGRLEDGDSSELPPWSRTHPAPSSRAHAVETELGREAAALPPDDEFVAKLHGLVIGVDPRNGDLNGDLYRHGRSGFAVDLPSGWKTKLVASIALASPPEGDVVLVVAPTLFPEPTVDRVLAAISASERIMLYEPDAYTVGGLPVVRAKFRTVEDPVTVGVFQLVQGSEGVITLLAAGSQPDWSKHARPVVRALDSQRQLTPADLAELEPAALSIVAAAQGQTLRDIATGPQELPMLRLLNRVPADEPLESGRLLKRAPATMHPPSPPPPPEGDETDALTDPFAPATAPERTLPDPFVAKEDA